MNGWFGLVALFAAWFAIQRWLSGRSGSTETEAVRTCAESGALRECRRGSSGGDAAHTEEDA